MIFSYYLLTPVCSFLILVVIICIYNKCNPNTEKLFPKNCWIIFLLIQALLYFMIAFIMADAFYIGFSYEEKREMYFPGVFEYYQDIGRLDLENQYTFFFQSSLVFYWAVPTVLCLIKPLLTLVKCIADSICRRKADKCRAKIGTAVQVLINIRHVSEMNMKKRQKIINITSLLDILDNSNLTKGYIGKSDIALSQIIDMHYAGDIKSAGLIIDEVINLISEVDKSDVDLVDLDFKAISDKTVIMQWKKSRNNPLLVIKELIK